MPLLQCYSKGDRRFSAMVAKLKSGHTIEEIYQASKRDKDGKRYPVPKGVQPVSLYLNQKPVPCTNELRHLFYTALWEVYFRESNFTLLEEAAQYEGFYEWQGSPVFTPATLNPEAFIQHAQSCNQAFSIAWHVGYRQRRVAPPFYPDIVCQAINRYWTKYHPEERI